jgi:anti-sigma B factor antagonist
MGHGWTRRRPLASTGAHDRERERTARAKTRDPDAETGFAIADLEVDALTQVIAVSGEVDLYAGPDFRRHVRAVIESGKRRLVVDLSHVRFMDSTGLGVLFSALKRLRSLDGGLAIVSDDPQIYSLFEVVGLERVLAIYPNRDAALSALCGVR